MGRSKLPPHVVRKLQERRGTEKGRRATADFYRRIREDGEGTQIESTKKDSGN